MAKHPHHDKIKINLFRIAILLLLFFGVFNTVSAQFTDPLGGELDGKMRDRFTIFKARAGFSNQPTSIEGSIAAMIEYLLSFLGVIFIILVIYSGFLWMTASGDEEQITKAKDILKSAVIGLIIVLGAFVVTRTILKYIGTAVKI